MTKTSLISIQFLVSLFAPWERGRAGIWQEWGKYNFGIIQQPCIFFPPGFFRWRKLFKVVHTCFSWLLMMSCLLSASLLYFFFLTCTWLLLLLHVHSCQSLQSLACIPTRLSYPDLLAYSSIVSVTVEWVSNAWAYFIVHVFPPV